MFPFQQKGGGPLIQHNLVLQRVEATLRDTNIAMENGPFEDVFPIENGDIPLLC